MTSTTDTPAGEIPVAWLFTPGTAAAHFGATAHSGAGVAILDLEDAVAPGEKDHARDLVLGHRASHRNEPPQRQWPRSCLMRDLRSRH
jgi:citrate lyase beta subunit